MHASAGGPLVAWTSVPPGHAPGRAEAALVDGDWRARQVGATGDFLMFGSAVSPDGALATGQLDPSLSLWDGAVRAAGRDAAGGWTESPPLRARDLGDLADGAIALLEDGRVLFVGIEQQDDGGEGAFWMAAATWDPAAGTWGPIRRSSAATGSSWDLQLAALADGTALAVAVTHRSSDVRVLATVIGGDGPIGGPRGVGVGRRDAGARVATGPDGRAVVAWDGPAGPMIRTRTPIGGWRSPSSAPALPCVEGGESVRAVATGPSGADLLVSGAAAWGDEADGLPRALVRYPEGAWARPVWLSRAQVANTVAGIDGGERLHVAWRTSGQLAGSRSVVQATSADPSGAGTPAVRQPTVPVVSRLRVVAAARSVAVRFHLTATAPVELSFVPAASGPDGPSRRIAAQRGRNMIRISSGGRSGLTRGRWTVSVDPVGMGCPVASSPFSVRPR
jgi:hypothetical protein